MNILLIFCFISGIFTFLAPCIWPLIPIVFSSALKSRNKSLGIVLGLSLSLLCVTLGASSAFSFLNLNNEQKCLMASIAIGTLGVILLFPHLAEKLETFLSQVSNKLGFKVPTNNETGLRRGILTGFAIGFVWAPCAAPIIGAVVSLSVTSQNLLQASILSMAYVLGFALPLILLLFVGNGIFTKLKILNKFTEKLQQVFGLLLIILAIGVCFGLDKNLSSNFLDSFPGYTKFYSKIYKQIENNQLFRQNLKDLSKSSQSNSPQ